MEDGSWPLALIATIVLIGGLWLETRILPRRRWTPWFTAGLPLHVNLVPIPFAPRRDAGRTSSVGWDRPVPHLVRWWGHVGERRVPAGLHGVVVLAQSRRGVELEFRWAPPWTLVLAPVWLASVGVARGDGPLAIALGALLLVAVVVSYGASAVRVAQELRWAFLGDDEV